MPRTLTISTTCRSTKIHAETYFQQRNFKATITDYYAELPEITLCGHTETFDYLDKM